MGCEYNNFILVKNCVHYCRWWITLFYFLNPVVRFFLCFDCFTSCWKKISLNFQLQKFREELKNRSRVLKKLGHIDADGVVQVKGRAACLIDTGDELLVTELMFNGESICISPLCSVCVLQYIMLHNLVFSFLHSPPPLGTFNELDHHQVAALASCFIPGDKSSDSQIQLRTELARPLQQLQDSARRIAEVFYHLMWYFLIIC